MGVEGMIIGRSSQKVLPRRCRRLTIQDGEHPCAENRGRRLGSPGDNTGLTSPHTGPTSPHNSLTSPHTGCYSAGSHGSRCSSSAEHFSNNCRNNNNNHSNYRKESSQEDHMEGSGVSYLSVPLTPSRRPSTADVMIEKLHVERHEEGSLSISGVALSAHCHLTLTICGTFCLLAGIVLTYVAYVNAGVPPPSPFSPTPNNLSDSTATAGATPSEFTTQAPTTKPVKDHNSNLTFVGPICIVTGTVMILVGLSLFALGRKIQRDEKEQNRLESEAQLEQLQRSFSLSVGTPLRTSIPTADQSYPILSLRRSSWWIDPSAVDVLTPTPPFSLPPVSPTVSTTPQSGLSSRATSPVPGGRCSFSYSAVPVWGFNERLDVGSFPTFEIDTPSKFMRVAQSPDKSKSVSDQHALPPPPYSDRNQHQQDQQQQQQQSQSQNRIEEDNNDDEEEDLHSNEEGRRGSTDLNALLCRTPDYEMVPRTHRQRSNSLITPGVVVSNHAHLNLPYQVPLIQVTPSSDTSQRSPSATSRSSSEPRSPVSRYDIARDAIQ